MSERHSTAQHSTAQHDAEEKKNEKMSQGRAGKRWESAISYLILGLFKNIFRKKSGEESKKKMRQGGKRKKCYG